MEQIREPLNINIPRTRNILQEHEGLNKLIDCLNEEINRASNNKRCYFKCNAECGVYGTLGEYIFKLGNGECLLKLSPHYNDNEEQRKDIKTSFLVVKMFRESGYTITTTATSFIIRWGG